MCVVGAFDKILHEGSIWTRPRSVLSLSSTNQYFFTLYIMVQDFLTYIQHLIEKKKYISDDRSHIFPKQKVRKLYNATYQNKYSIRYYVLKID